MKSTALVLGGTAAHIALLNELKARNYYTILVDYYPNPVAKPYADLHIQESTLDADKVVEIAQQYQADLVISACVDQANVVASYAMEKLGKTPPYSYEIAQRISNKGDMKKVMLEQGIPTARHIYLDGLEDEDISNLHFPVVVKPADCCGAAGVKKCDNKTQLEQHLPFAIDCSRNNLAVIEEFVEGVEISAYCFVSKGKAKVLATAERLSVIDGDKEVIKCYGTIMPSSLSEATVRVIEEAATKVAQAYGLDNTPLHIQAIVDASCSLPENSEVSDRNGVNIIEFAPRVGGGLSYWTIREKTGFDIISATVDSWEGTLVEAHLSDAPVMQAIHLIYAEPGEFDHIEGMQQIIEDGYAQAIFPYKTKGMEVADETASAGRVGAVVVSGATGDEILDKLTNVFLTISVRDNHGNDLMRRDLLLGKEEMDSYKSRKAI